MSNVYEIPAQEYNDKLAEALSKIEEFKMPEWAIYVKTGLCKLRPPMENDWWYNRAASILRQIYIKGVVGVGRLRTKYGDRKNRGMKPEQFAKASGKIIRVMLQQAEKAGLLEKVKEGKRFGRKLTKKGREFLEAIK
jgi:small subunit ribosomal protein S19e